MVSSQSVQKPSRLPVTWNILTGSVTVHSVILCALGSIGIDSVEPGIFSPHSEQ